MNYTINHTSQPSWIKNVGIELNRFSKSELEKIQEQVALQHIQVTVPGPYSPDEIESLPRNLELIIHSNLLNTFGENNWNELTTVAKRISKLKPKRTIEHFTQFIQGDTKKTGVFFDSSISEIKILDNVSKWKSMLDHELALENAPITENVDAYFNLLINLKNKIDFEIVCDVPHFFISALAANWTMSHMLEIAKALDPKQIHLGGISKTNQFIKDNHRMLTPWLIEYARQLFGNASSVTLEQSPMIPAASIPAMLQKLTSTPFQGIPEDILNSKVFTNEETNEQLAFDSFSIFKNFKISRFEGGYFSQEYARQNDPFYLLEKYTPFLYPISTIKGTSTRIQAKELLVSATALAQRALDIAEWLSEPTKKNLVIRFGVSDKLYYSTAINRDGINPKVEQDSIDKFSHLQKFVGENESWVEVATLIS